MQLSFHDLGNVSYVAHLFDVLGRELNIELLLERKNEIEVLRHEQAQLAMSLENYARSDDIQALRQEQAQLVRSLEALALTIASNPPRER